MVTRTVPIYLRSFSTAGGIFDWRGSATPDGVAVITDSDGILTDDNSGETATATVTIGSQTVTGRDVDAEASWTVRDPRNGNIFQIADMEIEGGGPLPRFVVVSEQPLDPNVNYQILSQSNNPSNSGSGITYSELTFCYTPDCLIDTPTGQRAAGDLCRGDLLCTGNGPAPILWACQSHRSGQGLSAPVEIPAGLFGATAPFKVSAQHRFVVADPQLELLIGTSRAFVTARQLVQAGLARSTPQQGVNYVHLLLPQHEVLNVHGVQSESFYPGATALEQMDAADRAALMVAHPSLATDPASYGPTALDCLRDGEAALILRAQCDQRMGLAA